jgi:hypothetical protein
MTIARIVPKGTMNASAGLMPVEWNPKRPATGRFTDSRAPAKRPRASMVKAMGASALYGRGQLRPNWAWVKDNSAPST